MNEHDAVRAANLEFYRAFNTADFPGMDALWAREAPVLCIHPGWTPLYGRAAVMRSWQDLFANPEPTRLMCHDDRAFLYGDTAVVLCEEELPGGHLVANNTFIREEGEWRMVLHQAGPLIARPYGDRPQRPN